MYFVHLFLRLKYGIDKFLVRKFPTEMPLGNFVRYVIFNVFKTFIPDFRPDMQGQIEIVWYENMVKHCSRRKVVTLRISRL